MLFRKRTDEEGTIQSNPGKSRGATVFGGNDPGEMTIKKVLANALVTEEQTKVWKVQLQRMALACRQVAAEVTIEVHRASTSVVCMSTEAEAALRRLAEETYVSTWSLGNAAKRWGPRLVVKEGRKTTEGCRSWAKAILLNGASRAHAWIKPPEQWSPDIVGAEDDGGAADRPPETRCLAGPIEALSQQRKIWKGWWQAGAVADKEADARLTAKLDHLVQRQEEGSSRWLPPDECKGSKQQVAEMVRRAQAPITGKEAYKAAHTFKQKTSRVGGIHPRQLGWIGHGGDAWENKAFAAYLNLVEQAGMFGEADGVLLI